MALHWHWLGSVPYGEMRARQRERVEAVAAGGAEPVLWLLEHPDVVTVGRGGDWDEARASGLPAVETERGGGLTWHGPGQLVGYPVVRLEDHDVHGHLRRVEEALIAWLGTLGIGGRREEGLTGVWVGAKKIASIGVAVRRWVAYHGFALNVAPDMSAFRRFRPCGLDPAVMTSLRELGVGGTPESCAPGVAAAFGAVRGAGA
ncbi:MAG: lipoyl(octanoyl) transferase LipB, partial [Candidatus Brocadiae bacterium]|nr:lipoyl(octanoyl) transferase LipB [Candidatus Brocadiia bacterium]